MSSLSAAMKSDNQRRRVVVVGAGIAGLTAAAHLVQSGICDVTVLEASNRYGGRMKTVQFGEGIIELGANWIHGATLTNSVFTLATQSHQPQPFILLDRMEGFCYTSHGAVVDPSISQKVWSLYQDIGRQIYTHKGDDFQVFESWLKNQFKTGLKLFKEEEKLQAQAVVNCLLNLARFHDGGYLMDMSVGASQQFTELPGGEVKLPKGVSSLLSPLIQVLPTSTIQYNQEVTSIRLSQADHNRPVEIICKSGSHMFADHVIITCSLGYLKQHHQTLFTPSLPSNKISAIENMGYGTVGKIFLYYKIPFWPTGKGGIKFCWSDEEAQPKTKAEWFKKIFAFDEVLNNPGVLIGWVSGDEAAYMESLSLQQVADDCSRLIKTFLGSPHLPDPTEVCRSNWSHDSSHCYGSYSYLRNIPSVIPILQQPVCSPDCVPRILFAGEATHEAFFSTMHGARSSGIREAERIINSLSKSYAKL